MMDCGKRKGSRNGEMGINLGYILEGDGQDNW